ncbi:zinc finger, CCHC-type containing protein [Tanacetum coccineum]|uniref:Zinc finger, CCHC-type containing protein n=1 Tax=Tanacetum coccineum TaxID=301880 RepID=A0ABQ4XDL3_9ASTR
MVAAAIKHMASNFAKLEKFEGVDFRRWQKKMHFLLSSMSVVYVLTTPMPEDGGENPTVEQVRKRAKWDNDDYVCRGLILNGMSDSLFDVYQNVETSKELWDTLEAKYMAEDASSKKFLVSNFTNYKMTDSRPVLEQYNELLGILGRFTQHKMNMDESIQVSCIIDKLPPSWKDFKHTLKHLKEELTLIELGSHLRIEESLRALTSQRETMLLVLQLSIWWSITTPPGTMTTTDDDVAWWVDSGAIVHVCKDRCWFKTYESLNNGSILHMGNESTALVHGRGCVDLRLNIVFDNIGSAFMSTSKLNDSILWHARLGHVHFKRMQDMFKDGLIPAFDMDTEKVDLCDLHATPLLGNKKYFVTFIDDASRAVVRLPDPKLKTLGERGIECIFVGYAEHSKAFRFYVIEPNDSVVINSIIESRDVIFDEHRFSSVPRPSQRSLVKGTEDSGGSVVSKRVTDEIVQQSEPELRKSKRHRTPKDFRPEFQLYLIEGTRDEVSDQHSYCFNVEDDPKTFDEAMKSQDVAFWKEAINDEMDSIMGNNTWVLTDLPPGCRPLGCKWIFKRKLKVDGTVEKVKARLVIQGFKQKSGLDYFDTYAPVARISTIRLLIAMASIHSLIIHQMDMKTAFLNGEMEEEVYMNQPLGFILPGYENKVCKLVKSLYGLKQALKQWHQKFEEVVSSNGYLLNQADKCVYSKFDASGKGVIICLYVDDMLIFGTDQVQVDLTKEFLSSRFSMKDIGEAYVILGIRIKHESNGIAISQSYYIEKVLKKFKYSDCTPVSTPLDTYEKLMPNRGLAVSQLDYSRVIGCLMYVMTYTRPDIAFVVGKLSRYTSNPGTQHWQAIQRVLKYLKKTMDYRLVYYGYPSVLEGYTDAGPDIAFVVGKLSRYTSNPGTQHWQAIQRVLKYLIKTMDYRLAYSGFLQVLEALTAACAATLAKAYSQMYNGKSRHLGVRHSMIREQIMNGVISIEFVRDVLGTCYEENEVANFSMVNFFEKMLSRSRNKEEPPI